MEKLIHPAACCALLVYLASGKNNQQRILAKKSQQTFLFNAKKSVIITKNSHASHISRE